MTHQDQIACNLVTTEIPATSYRLCSQSAIGLLHSAMHSCTGYMAAQINCTASRVTSLGKWNGVTNNNRVLVIESVKLKTMPLRKTVVMESNITFLTSFTRVLPALSTSPLSVKAAHVVVNMIGTNIDADALVCRKNSPPWPSRWTRQAVAFEVRLHNITTKWQQVETRVFLCFVFPIYQKQKKTNN